MLQLQHVTIKDLKDHTLVNDLSFSLGEHDKLALIGEEGNGKSTLLKAIYNQKLIESYTSISGKIDMTYRQVGYLSQTMDTQWQDACCLDYLFKQQINDEIEPEAYNELPTIQTLCIELQIPYELILSMQPIHTLSGGEKVKLQLLKLCFTRCELYLLDEPTNDLDLSTLQWLEQFIQQATVPVIFVSHDETLLSKTANRIFHLEQRNKKTKPVITKYRGSYAAYKQERTQLRKKEEQIAVKEKQEYRKKQEKLNDVRNAVHDAQNAVSRQCPHVAQMLKKKMHTVKAMERRMEGESYRKTDSVEDAIDITFTGAEGIRQKVILEKTYEVIINEQTLIQPYELHVYGKDKIAIIGSNGCGKTQLMKRIYEDLSHRTDIKLGYMPQQYADLMDSEQSAYHFLMEKGDHEDLSRSRQLLGRMKFTSEEMLAPIKALSEGQKAKLYLMRFIKQSCNVLLLDEPTRNLSPLSAPIIHNVLSEYEGCIIAVSHDRIFLNQVFDKILEVKDCKITERKTII